MLCRRAGLSPQPTPKTSAVMIIFIRINEGICELFSGKPHNGNITHQQRKRIAVTYNVAISSL